ncbi:Tubulin--tyrosine ligase-like protein 12 [Channa argus]|nr:Tubulin--tyrosine ligase-like protein 12 [Channa argus]
MVKFDFRYMLMLRSVQPLRLYAYNVFWLRFANRPFCLNHFDDYQKHFTVMNYAEGVELKQVHYDEFIPMFEQQYPQYPWTEVEAELFKSFRELFQAASARPPPYGICPYPSSRAIYAADIMLKWKTRENGDVAMQPQILELNFSPDCTGPAYTTHPSTTTFSRRCFWMNLKTSRSHRSYNGLTVIHQFLLNKNVQFRGLSGLCFPTVFYQFVFLPVSVFSFHHLLSY